MMLLRALGYAVANLLHPRMLWLMAWPMLIAAAIWGVVAALLCSTRSPSCAPRGAE